MSGQEPLRVVILGATSGIAEATARIYAREGARLMLASRNGERLEQIAGDLRLRGATEVAVATLELAGDVDAEAELASMVLRLGGVDHLLVAYGMMTQQEAAAQSPALIADVIRVNLTSAAFWILAAADLFERQRHGSLVVIGSPAGDRGRRRNFIYGMSKAGLATLIEGVAHRFGSSGPRAVLVKPGPTATPMTAAMHRHSAMADPDTIARGIRRAADRGPTVQYVPPTWAITMRIVRLIPSALFNRFDF